MALVLVIDDSRLVGMVLQRMLTEQGIESVQARSAAEVFGMRGQPSLLRERRPDLILLDIMMPDMDGLDILRKLKSMKEERRIPVLMISASAHENNIVEAVNRGAEGFVSKPVAADTLMKTLAEIAVKHGIDPLIHKLSRFLDPGRTATQTQASLVVGPADLNYMLEILDGDTEMLRELIEVFVEDAPAQVEAITEAVKAGDPALVRRTAHTFKGSVGNMGAPALTEKAFALEKMGRDDALEEAPALERQLREQAEALLSALRKWLAD